MPPVRALVTTAVIVTAGAVASAEPCADVTKLACSTGTVADGAGVLVCAAPPGVERVVVLARRADGMAAEAPMARSACRFAGRLPASGDFEIIARDADGRVVATIEQGDGATPRDAADTKPPPCGVGLYLEPSLLFTIGIDGPLVRGAAGIHVHDCSRHRIHAHVGLTGYEAAGGGGIGGELELGVRVAPTLVVGVRGGVETVSFRGADFSTGATRFTLGVRLRLSEQAFLAVDGFHQTDGTLIGAPSVTGAMFGGGLDGRLGAYTTGIALGAGALLGLLYIGAMSRTH